MGTGFTPVPILLRLDSYEEGCSCTVVWPRPSPSRSAAPVTSLTLTVVTGVHELIKTFAAELASVPLHRTSVAPTWIASTKPAVPHPGADTSAESIVKFAAAVVLTTTPSASLMCQRTVALAPHAVTVSAPDDTSSASRAKVAANAPIENSATATTAAMIHLRMPVPLSFADPFGFPPCRHTDQ